MSLNQNTGLEILLVIPVILDLPTQVVCNRMTFIFTQDVYINLQFLGRELNISAQLLVETFLKRCCFSWEKPVFPFTTRINAASGCFSSLYDGYFFRSSSTTWNFTLQWDTSFYDLTHKWASRVCSGAYSFLIHHFLSLSTIFSHLVEKYLFFLHVVPSWRKKHQFKRKI